VYCVLHTHTLGGQGWHTCRLVGVKAKAAVRRTRGAPGAGRERHPRPRPAISISANRSSSRAARVTTAGQPHSLPTQTHPCRAPARPQPYPKARTRRNFTPPRIHLPRSIVRAGHAILILLAGTEIYLLLLNLSSCICHTKRDELTARKLIDRNAINFGMHNLLRLKQRV